jgi:uncharacterized protein with gpF-like domain
MARTPTRKTTATSETKAKKNKTQRRIQRHVLLAAAYERGLQNDIEKTLKRIIRAAAKHVANGSESQADKVTAAYQSGLTRVFEARLEVAAMASAKLVFEELNTEKSAGPYETKFISLFEVAQAAVRAWLTSYGAAKVTQILENTRLQIRRSLVRGHDQNEPPRVLARRLNDETGGLVAKRRAETIARTETHIAANVGSDAAASATGLQLEKEWCATEDARTRPDHAEADAQRVDKNMDFIVGGERLSFPGDPKGSARQVINCRCVVLWHPKVPK